MTRHASMTVVASDELFYLPSFSVIFFLLWLTNLRRAVNPPASLVIHR